MASITMVVILALSALSLCGAAPLPRRDAIAFASPAVAPLPLMSATLRGHAAFAHAIQRKQCRCFGAGFSMISERQPGWEGYVDRSNQAQGFGERDLVGTWEVEWTQDDEKKTSKLVLYPDGSVSPPRHTEEQTLQERLQMGDAYFLTHGSWRLKHEEVTIVIDRHAGQEYSRSILTFSGAIKGDAEGPYGSVVKGNVLDGEVEPDWLGRFTLRQQVGRASLGMAPSGPPPKKVSRASSGFALGGRSDQAVLARFADCWSASATLDGDRVSMQLDLHQNGTFATHEFSRLSDNGLTGGVLRGRWNIYYSEDAGKDRFWMQVLRLKCSGVGLWSDLLFLGDIDVIDGWAEIEEQLKLQRRQLQALDDVATDEKAVPLSTAATAPNASAAALHPDHPDFRRAEEEEERKIEEERLRRESEVRPGVTLAPEKRGLFTLGKPRRYCVRGHIIAGHQFEPAIVGTFKMLMGEASGTLQSEILESRLGGSEDHDLGLGGGDEL